MANCPWSSYMCNRVTFSFRRKRLVADECCQPSVFSARSGLFELKKANSLFSSLLQNCI